MRTFCDADWAGCKETMEPTTGGCITAGSHTIKSLSAIHAFIALSSGESELYVALKAAAETLGMVAIFDDLGWSLK